MTAQKYLAYTYLIGWTDQDRWYYGVRWENVKSQRTPENDFWTYYKTSSKPVKHMIAFVGEPDYISIDKTFESIEEAIEYETKVLTEMDVLNNDEWLNQNISGAIIQTEETKRKIGLIHKGKKLSKKVKNKMSESTKGENHPMYGKFHSEETKEKISKKVKGENHPFYGKKHSEETKQKISKSKKEK